LPQTTINKAINDFMQTSERMRFGRWWTFTWTRQSRL